MVQLFPCQVPANKDHGVPVPGQSLPRSDGAWGPRLLPAPFPLPTVSSGCWPVPHGQQPACGNNESKSGSAILCKPLYALCVCASARAPALPSPPSLSFLTPLLPPALVLCTRCRAGEPGEVAQCCCSGGDNRGWSLSVPDAPGPRSSSGPQPAMSSKHQKPRSCSTGKSQEGLGG